MGIFLSSGDLLLDRRYRWALDYLARGDRAAASELLEQLVEAAPGFAAPWFALAELKESQGDRQRAIAAFAAARDADGADHQGARLHLARLGVGDITPTMLAEHVRRTFDEHAPHFEESLHRLDYRGPQLLLKAVMAAAPAAGRAPRFRSMLDLGCGTGLAGQAFRGEVDRLSGIDLSAAMLHEASRKGIYDRLARGELIAFLAAEAAGGTRHDLVIAADMLVYLPDLAPAARAVARVLAPSGLFAFSVETHGGGGALLRPTLRYAHGSAHVRAAIADAGLDLPYLAEAAARSEKGEPVGGLIAVASRQREAAQAAGAT